MFRFLIISMLITSSLFSETLILFPFNGIEHNDNISILEMFNEHISKTDTIKIINPPLMNYDFNSLNMKEYNEIMMNYAIKSNADYVLFGYLSYINETKKLNIKVMNIKNNNIIYSYPWSFEYIERIEYEISQKIYPDIVIKILDDSSMQF
ncbi:hypothetical protein Bint_1119 [Brachyspira intermedia PWS/A]|uniref:Uncharacterized protein n=1 Tax=Brachyspira intermedia (strain ATCC 51140 / PWS/A) TaxID=1045858 RepID=G0EMQ4_BRAIP|nr:hypothetical protein [Brachyspira intermedia]AEM21742.1 hypothetical protein Bint_1119 [Brachyspira intermedia PWS/A]